MTTRVHRFWLIYDLFDRYFRGWARVYVCPCPCVRVSWSKRSAFGELCSTDILKFLSHPRVKVSWKNVLGLPHLQRSWGPRRTFYDSPTKVKATLSFATAGISKTATQHNNPEDQTKSSASMLWKPQISDKFRSFIDTTLATERNANYARASHVHVSSTSWHMSSTLYSRSRLQNGCDPLHWSQQNPVQGLHQPGGSMSINWQEIPPSVVPSC
jgi:hypothetical protein